MTADLAVPAHNTRRPEIARCIGLGDRIAPVRITYAHSIAIGQPVRLHITSIMAGGVDRWSPTQAPRMGSWESILALFPPGHVSIVTHRASPQGTREWVAWLRAKGVHAETWHLGDTLGMLPEDYPIGIDASPYMRASPQIPPPEDAPGLVLPEARFVTMQPSGSVSENRCADAERDALIESYRALGYAVVLVGHEADDPLLRQSLRHVAYAQARAEIHVGADSGPMHLASLFKPYDRLRLISPGRVSRSRAHWLANGALEEPRP
jgi:hypothetical protein